MLPRLREYYGLHGLVARARGGGGEEQDLLTDPVPRGLGLLSVHANSLVSKLSTPPPSPLGILVPSPAGPLAFNLSAADPPTAGEARRAKVSERRRRLRS